MEQTQRRALVTGASIAGPVAAHWLARAGYEVEVVERAPAPRTAGQNIDVRGPGREVLRRMGLEQAALAANTGEVGTRFVREDGSVVAEFPAGDDDESGATAELEILRGRLAELVVEAAEGTGRVEVRYGDRIVEVVDAERGEVEFAEAGRRRYDLVVLAEGVRSATRTMLLGEEPDLRDLGAYMAYGTIARTSDDDAWWNWYVGTGRRGLWLRPDDVGSTRAGLSFMADPDGLEDLPADEQVARLREVFGDAGWQAERILASLEADHSDFYLERLRQVRLDRWSVGRVVLVGDAAWCATPVSGMGTTLAVTGGYLLGWAMTAHDDVAAGLAAFDERMRPIVDDAQRLPPGTPGVAHPGSRAGQALFRGATALAASRPVRAVADLVPDLVPERVREVVGTDEDELPDWPA